MEKKPFHVFGLGQACMDYIGTVAAYPPPDGKCEFSNLVIQGGGPVATALVALARWGVPCAFAGLLGDDMFGPFIRKSLDDEGIDTSEVIVRKGFESQFAFIATEPGVGTRTVFWRRPTGPPLSPGEINYSLIRNARVLHTDGIFVEASLAACKAARSAGVPVVVDAGSLREGLLDLAKVSDYFLASATFADAFIGPDKPLDACVKLAELGPRLVGITLGSKGVIVLDRGRVVERPAYPVEAVDTTGCGDIFHAGFIYGLLKAWDVEKILDFAVWTAAMASLKPGGRTGIPLLTHLQHMPDR
ncbi:MAG: PfkB family carbohydrate kinase [Thermodesulfobacteriota bacterium]|nr:PfkB family carbohydrate kinase [Thermodesulfobacteriota bacterium]